MRDEVSDMVRVSIGVSLLYDISICPCEKVATSYQVEKGRSKTKNVRFVAISFVVKDFRCDIPRSTAFRGEMLVIRGESRKSHIGDSNLILCLVLNGLN